MGANYSIVLSASNKLGTAISVGDLVVPDVADPSSYVVATTAALAGRRPEAVALTPVGSRKGSLQIQQVGTIPASVSGYTGGESWVRCSAAGRIEACAANDALLIGRAEADGRVHLLFAFPLVATVPAGNADALVGLDGLGGLKNLTSGVIPANSIPYWDGSKLAWLTTAGRAQGDVLSLGLGLSLGWSVGGGGGFNPAVLPNGSATLRARYDIGNSSNGGGLLTALPDLSGNGYNTTIPGGAEPTYTAVDAAYNNRPTITFPASNTKRIVIPNVGITTGPYTMVWVGDANSAAAYMTSNTGGVGGDQSQIFCISTTSTIFSSKANPGFLTIQEAAALPTVKNVVVAVGNGATSRIYQSKKTLGGAASGNAGTHDLTGTTMMLGNYANNVLAAYSQNGKTAEVLIYSGAMVAADVAYLLDGLGAKYGITIAP